MKTAILQMRFIVSFVLTIITNKIQGHYFRNYASENLFYTGILEMTGITDYLEYCSSGVC